MDEDPENFAREQLCHKLACYTDSEKSNKMERFPFLVNILQDISSKLTCEIISKDLLQSMDDFITCIQDEALQCSNKPGRAMHLAKTIIDMLFIFKSILSNHFDELITSEYLNRASKILTTYLEMELKASVKAKINHASIANHIAVNIDMHLQANDEHQILDIFINMNRLISIHKDILLKLFQKYLYRPIVLRTRELDDELFIKYVILYKTWKNIETNANEKRRITDLCVSFVKPKKSLWSNKRLKLLLGKDMKSINQSQLVTFMCTKISINELKKYTRIKDPCLSQDADSDLEVINDDLRNINLTSSNATTSSEQVIDIANIKMEKPTVVDSIDLTEDCSPKMPLDETRLHINCRWLESLCERTKEFQSIQFFVPDTSARSSEDASDVIEIHDEEQTSNSSLRDVITPCVETLCSKKADIERIVEKLHKRGNLVNVSVSPEKINKLLNSSQFARASSEEATTSTKLIRTIRTYERVRHNSSSCSSFLKSSSVDRSKDFDNYESDGSTNDVNSNTRSSSPIIQKSLFSSLTNLDETATKSCSQETHESGFNITAEIMNDWEATSTVDEDEDDDSGSFELEVAPGTVPRTAITVSLPLQFINSKNLLDKSPRKAFRVNTHQPRLGKVSFANISAAASTSTAALKKSSLKSTVQKSPECDFVFTTNYINSIKKMTTANPNHQQPLVPTVRFSEENFCTATSNCELPGLNRRVLMESPTKEKRRTTYSPSSHHYQPRKLPIYTDLVKKPTILEKKTYINIPRIAYYSSNCTDVPYLPADPVIERMSQNKDNSSPQSVKDPYHRLITPYSSEFKSNIGHASSLDTQKIRALDAVAQFSSKYNQFIEDSDSDDGLKRTTSPNNNRSLIFNNKCQAFVDPNAIDPKTFKASVQLMDILQVIDKTKQVSNSNNLKKHNNSRRSERNRGRSCVKFENIYLDNRLFEPNFKNSDKKKLPGRRRGRKRKNHFEKFGKSLTDVESEYESEVLPNGNEVLNSSIFAQSVTDVESDFEIDPFMVANSKMASLPEDKCKLSDKIVGRTKTSESEKEQANEAKRAAQTLFGPGPKRKKLRRKRRGYKTTKDDPTQGTGDDDTMRRPSVTVESAFDLQSESVYPRAFSNKKKINSFTELAILPITSNSTEQEVSEDLASAQPPQLDFPFEQLESNIFPTTIATLEETPTDTILETPTKDVEAEERSIKVYKRSSTRTKINDPTVVTPDSQEYEQLNILDPTLTMKVVLTKCDAVPVTNVVDCSDHAKSVDTPDKCSGSKFGSTKTSLPESRTKSRSLEREEPKAHKLSRENVTFNRFFRSAENLSEPTTRRCSFFGRRASMANDNMSTPSRRLTRKNTKSPTKVSGGAPIDLTDKLDGKSTTRRKISPAKELEAKCINDMEKVTNFSLDSEFRDGKKSMELASNKTENVTKPTKVITTRQKTRSRTSVEDKNVSSDDIPPSSVTAAEQLKPTYDAWDDLVNKPASIMDKSDSSSTALEDSLENLAEKSMDEISTSTDSIKAAEITEEHTLMLTALLDAAENVQTTSPVPLVHSSQQEDLNEAANEIVAQILHPELEPGSLAGPTKNRRKNKSRKIPQHSARDELIEILSAGNSSFKRVNAEDIVSQNLVAPKPETTRKTPINIEDMPINMSISEQVKTSLRNRKSAKSDTSQDPPAKNSKSRKILQVNKFIKSTVKPIKNEGNCSLSLETNNSAVEMSEDEKPIADLVKKRGRKPRIADPPSPLVVEPAPFDAQKVDPPAALEISSTETKKGRKSKLQIPDNPSIDTAQQKIEESSPLSPAESSESFTTEVEAKQVKRAGRKSKTVLKEQPITQTLYESPKEAKQQQVVQPELSTPYEKYMKQNARKSKSFPQQYLEDTQPTQIEQKIEVQKAESLDSTITEHSKIGKKMNRKYKELIVVENVKILGNASASVNVAEIENATNIASSGNESQPEAKKASRKRKPTNIFEPESIKTRKPAVADTDQSSQSSSQESMPLDEQTDNLNPAIFVPKEAKKRGTKAKGVKNILPAQNIEPINAVKITETVSSMISMPKEVPKEPKKRGRKAKNINHPALKIDHLEPSFELAALAVQKEIAETKEPKVIRKRGRKAKTSKLGSLALSQESEISVDVDAKETDIKTCGSESENLPFDEKDTPKESANLEESVADSSTEPIIPKSPEPAKPLREGHSRKILLVHKFRKTTNDIKYVKQISPAAEKSENSYESAEILKSPPENSLQTTVSRTLSNPNKDHCDPDFSNANTIEVDSTCSNELSPIEITEKADSEIDTPSKLINKPINKIIKRAIKRKSKLSAADIMNELQSIEPASLKISSDELKNDNFEKQLPDENESLADSNPSTSLPKKPRRVQRKRKMYMPKKRRKVPKQLRTTETTDGELPSKEEHSDETTTTPTIDEEYPQLQMQTTVDVIRIESEEKTTTESTLIESEITSPLEESAVLMDDHESNSSPSIVTEQQTTSCETSEMSLDFSEISGQASLSVEDKQNSDEEPSGQVEEIDYVVNEERAVVHLASHEPTIVKTEEEPKCSAESEIRTENNETSLDQIDITTPTSNEPISATLSECADIHESDIDQMSVEDDVELMLEKTVIERRVQPDLSDDIIGDISCEQNQPILNQQPGESVEGCETGPPNQYTAINPYDDEPIKSVDEATKMPGSNEFYEQSFTESSENDNPAESPEFSEEIVENPSPEDVESPKSKEASPGGGQKSSEDADESESETSISANANDTASENSNPMEQFHIAEEISLDSDEIFIESRMAFDQCDELKITPNNSDNSRKPKKKVRKKFPRHFLGKRRFPIQKDNQDQDDYQQQPPNKLSVNIWQQLDHDGGKQHIELVNSKNVEISDTKLKNNFTISYGKSRGISVRGLQKRKLKQDHSNDGMEGDTDKLMEKTPENNSFSMDEIDSTTANCDRVEDESLSTENSPPTDTQDESPFDETEHDVETSKPTTESPIPHPSDHNINTNFETMFMECLSSNQKDIINDNALEFDMAATAKQECEDDEDSTNHLNDVLNVHPICEVEEAEEEIQANKYFETIKSNYCVDDKICQDNLNNTALIDSTISLCSEYDDQKEIEDDSALYMSGVDLITGTPSTTEGTDEEEALNNDSHVETTMNQIYDILTNEDEETNVGGVGVGAPNTPENVSSIQITSTCPIMLDESSTEHMATTSTDKKLQDFDNEIPKNEIFDQSLLQKLIDKSVLITPVNSGSSSTFPTAYNNDVSSTIRSPKDDHNDESFVCRADSTNPTAKNKRTYTRRRVLKRPPKIEVLPNTTTINHFSQNHKIIFEKAKPNFIETVCLPSSSSASPKNETGMHQHQMFGNFVNTATSSRIDLEGTGTLRTGDYTQKLKQNSTLQNPLNVTISGSPLPKQQNMFESTGSTTALLLSPVKYNKTSFKLINLPPIQHITNPSALGASAKSFCTISNNLMGKQLPVIMQPSGGICHNTSVKSSQNFTITSNNKTYFMSSLSNVMTILENDSNSSSSSSSSSMSFEQQQQQQNRICSSGNVIITPAQPTGNTGNIKVKPATMPAQLFIINKPSPMTVTTVAQMMKSNTSAVATVVKPIHSSIVTTTYAQMTSTIQAASVSSPPSILKTKTNREPIQVQSIQTIYPAQPRLTTSMVTNMLNNGIIFNENSNTMSPPPPTSVVGTFPLKITTQGMQQRSIMQQEDLQPKKRGRPKGSKNKAIAVVTDVVLNKPQEVRQLPAILNKNKRMKCDNLATIHQQQVQQCGSSSSNKTFKRKSCEAINFEVEDDDCMSMNICNLIESINSSVDSSQRLSSPSSSTSAPSHYTHHPQMLISSEHHMLSSSAASNDDHLPSKMLPPLQQQDLTLRASQQNLIIDYTTNLCDGGDTFIDSLNDIDSASVHSYHHEDDFVLSNR